MNQFSDEENEDGWRVLTRWFQTSAEISGHSPAISEISLGAC
jgi:hypothetical protein